MGEFCGDIARSWDWISAGTTGFYAGLTRWRNRYLTTYQEEQDARLAEREARLTEREARLTEREARLAAEARIVQLEQENRRGSAARLTVSREAWNGLAFAGSL